MLVGGLCPRSLSFEAGIRNTAVLPRSSIVYIELLNSLHTLFIFDLPKLGYRAFLSIHYLNRFVNFVFGLFQVQSISCDNLNFLEKPCARRRGMSNRQTPNSLSAAVLYIKIPPAYILFCRSGGACFRKLRALSVKK